MARRPRVDRILSEKDLEQLQYDLAHLNESGTGFLYSGPSGMFPHRPTRSGSSVYAATRPGLEAIEELEEERDYSACRRRCDNIIPRIAAQDFYDLVASR
jgi:hypothetical protein